VAVTTKAGDAAGASPPQNATKLIAEVRRIADDTRKNKNAAIGKTTVLQTQTIRFLENNIPEVRLLLDGAKVGIDQGNFRGAASKLDEAARLVRRAGAQEPRLDDLYGELYTGMARNAADPVDRRKHLQRAQAVYRRIEQTGTGARAQDATEHLGAIADELDQSGQP
jgi:hypothetical protein